MRSEAASFQPPPDRADVVVVGAGPAGLAAATELRRAGVGSVVVLDREPVPGGIPRHCGHYPYGLREFGRLMKGPAYASRLVAGARASGATLCPGVTVTALRPGPVLEVTSDAGPGEIVARLVLLATGCRETTRTGRALGGTKPGGVMNTGALQGLVYLNGQRPFHRPVILGTELVAFSALLTCRHLGIRPVALVEPNPRTTARWPSGLFPRMLGIPLHLCTRIERIEGGAQVTGVILRRGEDTWRLAADGVILTGGFRPEAALLAGSHLIRDPATGGPQVDSLGRTSDPGYFAAGNVLRGVETAGAVWAEGRAVARAMTRALLKDAGKGDPDRTAPPILVGPNLRYAMPQRVATGAPALDHLQLRVDRPVRGWLSLRVDGVEIAGRRIDALPERRISLPLPPPVGQASVSLEET